MLYLKALHIIFVVTWFSGMFYIVRLFIYNTEAQKKSSIEKDILTQQYSLMIRRLWKGITIPSAWLTLLFGGLTLWRYGYIYNFSSHTWLHWKLGFVFLLYIYFWSLHRIYSQQLQGQFKWTSNQLRIWNEMATIFLVSIVFLVVVRSTMSWVWGLFGLFGFIILLMSAIQIYKISRKS